MASCRSSSTSSGPVTTGSQRRRLVLKLSQKDALQSLFQEKPYPGIATRERLAQELGIAQSRVQVWFQNQRRRWLKQSRSPSEYVHQEGEAGPTSTPTPLTPSSQPQSSSPDMVSKLKSSAPPAGPEWARQRSSHDYSCSRGPKGPTRFLAPRQPGQGAILPPGQPEAHIPRWPESSYGKGTAPQLETQTQPRSLPSPTSLLDELMANTGVLSFPGPFPRAAANQGVDPALPGTPSLLDKLLAATSVPTSLGPSPGASAVTGQQPALAGTPSLLEEILAATSICATLGPSLGPCADERAHLALPGSPRLQDEFLASPGIPGLLGAFLGSSSIIAGAHLAFPGSPSFLEEILAATAMRDMPWSSLGAPAGDEGVEATLEARLSQEDYQALLDMLPGSPGPVTTGSPRRRLILKLSQKDTLQAIFQQNPYSGIATRERLA
ncbi:double homeobox protein 4-like [Budorcas taxicolor]|uniref:double homeobox protein 4-like n=1 Tax=Budorcas taxicolor TaxID=37181 RepID=UPI002284AB15|nr:double homeobox protein 4-like [Budorcas taxicolor]